jgi:predicted ATPase
VDDRERDADRVAQLLGAGGEAVAEETLWAVRKLFESMATSRPVVFVIDDIQWAEPTMLDLIEYIADWSRDAPILLACMARPELLEQRPSWGGGKLNATAIALEPLSTEECKTLVANLLAVDDVSAEVRERVAIAADGHPLFAEEMLSTLVEDGLVIREHGRWVAAADLSDVAVPPTISALLAARLDRLDGDERAFLERASVIGQVFYADAVATLSEADGALSAMASLVRRQFVRAERSDLPGVEALAFRHLLIRDAAYDQIPKALRADLHERFADWLEERVGGADRGAAGDRWLPSGASARPSGRARSVGQPSGDAGGTCRDTPTITRADERSTGGHAGGGCLLERAGALMVMDSPAAWTS